MKQQVKQILANDISKWQAEGWIDLSTMNILAQRYKTEAFSLERGLKYLVAIGGIFLFFGIISFITMMTDSKILAIIMMLCASAGFLIWGKKLYRDQLDRYHFSSQALLAISLIFYGGAVTLALVMADFDTNTALIIAGIFWLVPSFRLAYSFRNLFILIIANISLFHWLGAWNEILGRSVYAFPIQNPHAMAVAAFFVILVGLGHLRSRQEWMQSFASVYIVMGLLYLNMSILILSINDKNKLIFIILGFVLGLIQIVIGSRLKMKIFTGFGMTFIGINLFTRYFESFWNEIDKYLFFIIGGSVLMIIGILLELWQKKGGDKVGEFNKN